MSAVKTTISVESIKAIAWGRYKLTLTEAEAEKIYRSVYQVMADRLRIALEVVAKEREPIKQENSTNGG